MRVGLLAEIGVVIHRIYRGSCIQSFLLESNTTKSILLTMLFVQQNTLDH